MYFFAQHIFLFVIFFKYTYVLIDFPMLLGILQCLNIFQLNVRDPFLSLAGANMSGIFFLSDYSLQEACRISDIVTRVEKTRLKCCCNLQQGAYMLLIGS